MMGGGKTDRRRCTRTEKVGEGGEILFQVPVKELFRVTFREMNVEVVYIRIAQFVSTVVEILRLLLE